MAKKKAKKRKAFGGMTICFKGCKDPIEKVFGPGKVAPSLMNKKLWGYIKKKKLIKR
jgi:hypothetical protein